MRRTAVLLTLLSLLPVSSAAAAGDVHVLDHGRVVVRHDPYLPPPDPMPRAAAPAPAAAAPRAVVAHAAAKKPKKTVASELQRLADAGAITPEQHDASSQTWKDARASLKKLTGRRAVELGAVLRSTESLAASGQLTAARVPVLTEIVARNREWWTTGSLLGYGARARFTGSRIVWQSYPGNGIQPQWLGTFGDANGFYKSKKNTALGEILDDALALASPRAGGIAWESFFTWSGAPPVWVSAITQGTAIQALSRASQRLARPDLLDAAGKALGIFQTPPPAGVMLKTDAGAHYLMYSTNPRLLILNGFLQSLVGLYDFSDISGDATGRQIFDAGDAEARVEVPSYDTGAWSLYDGSRESDLGYHQLVQGFLQNLCDRTDESVYCSTAQDFKDQETEPPVLRIRTTKGTAGKSVPVTFTVTKISRVSLFVNDVPISSASVGRGTHVLTWAGRRKPGDINVRVDATDLAGNKGSVAKIIKLEKARKARKPRKPGK